MADINHRIGVRVPVPKLYEAIATSPGLQGWWTAKTEGTTEVGGKIHFSFLNPDSSVKGSFRMQVTRSAVNEEVLWTVVEGPADWIGTELSFRFKEGNGMSILLFGHNNWKEANEHHHHCSMKWATFLLSLREYLERGAGRPSPHDLKIDDWN